MSTNNYFYMCSKELLKQLLEFPQKIKNKSVFNKDANYSIDPSWILISTSLLLSENLLKNENIYKKINQKQFNMLENLICKEIDDYTRLESYFLNENNQEICPFHFYLNEGFSNEYISNFENDYEDDYIIEEFNDFGCNKAIINNSVINYQELIIRIRNSIAHSNYEIIDDDYIRLYHYNENQELDFNVKINIILVLTVIDELNELAYKIYEPFLEEYIHRNEEIQYTTHELSDKTLLNYLLKFEIFTEEEIKEILNIAKQDPEFYPNYETDNNYTKICVIYDIIFEKIKPSCDYGIILNEIIFQMRRKNQSYDNYFYEKYGYYNYFNSNLYETSGVATNESLIENQFKIILLSYLNSLLLYNYNSNKEIDYSKIDFSSMIIDEDIKKEYIKTKYKHIQNSFKALSLKEKELLKLSDSLRKLEFQINSAQIKNQFLEQVLPTRINTIKEKYQQVYQNYLLEKQNTQQEMYDKLFEINDLKDNYNIDKTSKYIVNHLRNSLAHGYISFPIGLDYIDIFETFIRFEDYDKSKNKKTFGCIIKLGDLLSTLSNKKVIDVLFDENKKAK